MRDRVHADKDEEESEARGVHGAEELAAFASAIATVRPLGPSTLEASALRGLGLALLFLDRPVEARRLLEPA